MHLPTVAGDHLASATGERHPISLALGGAGAGARPLRAPHLSAHHASEIVAPRASRSAIARGEPDRPRTATPARPHGILNVSVGAPYNGPSAALGNAAASVGVVVTRPERTASSRTAKFAEVRAVDRIRVQLISPPPSRLNETQQFGNIEPFGLGRGRCQF